MCSAPEAFDNVTVSPSLIVSVDGEKQKICPPQLAPMVTAASPAAPAPETDASEMAQPATPMKTPTSSRRTPSYTSGARGGFNARFQAAGVGMACAHTIWRSSSTARHRVSTFASSAPRESAAAGGDDLLFEAATSWS